MNHSHPTQQNRGFLNAETQRRGGGTTKAPRHQGVGLMGLMGCMGLIIALCLAGCETVDGKRRLTADSKAVLSRLAQDVGEIAASSVKGAVSGVAGNMVGQMLGGQEFDPAAMQSAAIWGAVNGAGAGVRSLAGAKRAPSAEQIRQAVAGSTGSPVMSAKLAPGVSKAITKAIAKGAKPDAALERAAKSLDAEAAKAAEALRGV